MKFTFINYISMGLLISAGSVLLTPLAAGPSVLLAFIAFLIMLIKGRGTLINFGQKTLSARNILLIIYGGWFLAEFLSTVTSNLHWQNLDYPMRFIMGIGVFWIIRYASITRPELFYYAIVASAPVAAARSTYQHFVLEIERASGWTNFPIYFGNFCVLLCIYSIIMLVSMREKLSSQMRIAFLIAILLLLYSAFLSGSRSSWLGFAGLLVLFDWHHVNKVRLIVGGLFVVSSLAITLMLIPELSSSLRITEAIQDATRIMNGDYRSSIGDRLQMWKAAILMFSDSPLLGVGSGNYQAEVANLVESGAVDIELFQGNTIYNQAHSEILDVLATKGIVGLIAYLALLILPFRFFGTIIANAHGEAKALALMGQATTIAFLMFGLTLATFKIQIYCAVYPVTIAIFAALTLKLTADAEKAELQHAQGNAG